MSASAMFFADLAQEPHNVLLEKATGAIRFALSHGKRTDTWVVSIRRGDVEVFHGDANAPATTCNVSCSRELFDEIAAGRANAMAAMLRGALTVEGDLDTMMLFTRVLPGPPGVEHPRTRMQLVKSAR